MWRALDPEQKQEVSERAFFSFLREKKILTEKKQVDEMLRQCLFLKKGEESLNFDIESQYNYKIMQERADFL